MKWSAVIEGQPRSKANSRVVTRWAGVIKNPQTLVYVNAVKVQALAQRPPRLLEGRLSFKGSLYYPDNRSDLDPSALVDALEGIVYANDRQIKHWDIVFRVDKARPRAEIEVEEIGE